MADVNPGEITSVSGPLTPATDSNESLTDFVTRTKHQQEQVLRYIYAIAAITFTGAQIVAINLFFYWGATRMVPVDWVFFRGVGPMATRTIPFTPDPGVFKTFTVAVFVEVVAFAAIVMRSLFPGEGKGFWGEITGALLDAFSRKGR